MSNILQMLADASKNLPNTLPNPNPPEAAQVLETQTAPEVAGVPEPPVVVPEVPAPVAKPADVVAAEAVKKPRKTAASVQAEFDAYRTEIQAQLEELDSGVGARDMLEELKTAEAANEEALRVIQDLQAKIGELESAPKAAGAPQSLTDMCKALMAQGFVVKLEMAE